VASHADNIGDDGVIRTVPIRKARRGKNGIFFGASPSSTPRHVSGKPPFYRWRLIWFRRRPATGMRITPVHAHVPARMRVMSAPGAFTSTTRDWRRSGAGNIVPPGRSQGEVPEFQSAGLMPSGFFYAASRLGGLFPQQALNVLRAAGTVSCRVEVKKWPSIPRICSLFHSPPCWPDISATAAPCVTTGRRDRFYGSCCSPCCPFRWHGLRFLVGTD
jgi:hypothetical protein